MKIIIFALCLISSFIFASTDVFIIAGQSNASGKATHNQTYTGSDVLFANDYTIKSLVDPTDDGTGQIDTVSLDSAGGSVWPLVFTNVDTITTHTIMLVPCALSGSSILDWEPGAVHTNRSTLYGSMVWRGMQSRTNGTLKGILWWQGETDGLNSMSQISYSSNLTVFGTNVLADLGVPIISCKLQNCTGLTSGQETAINNAIVGIWGTKNFIQGPDLNGITTDDGFHLASDANIASAALLWAISVTNKFYTPNYYPAPFRR